MTKEKVAEIVFDLCNDKTRTTRDVVDGFIKEVGEDQVLNKSAIEDSIRRYRQAGKGLEKMSENILRNIKIPGLIWDYTDTGHPDFGFKS